MLTFRVKGWYFIIDIIKRDNMTTSLTPFNISTFRNEFEMTGDDIDIGHVTKFVLKSIGDPKEVQIAEFLEHLIQEENTRKNQYGEDLIYYCIHITILYFMYKKLKNMGISNEESERILQKMTETWDLILKSLN